MGFFFWGGGGYSVSPTIKIYFLYTRKLLELRQFSDLEVYVKIVEDIRDPAT
jgi:hypothetical protein